MKKLLLTMMVLAMTAAALQAKTLVVYYSFTNNCRTIANDLKGQLADADLVEVLPAEEDLDYAANNYAIGSALIYAIRSNPNDASSYPAIKDMKVDFSQYDDMVIATPLWWSNMAAPMQSFLFQNGKNMAGKKIGLIVFNLPNFLFYNVSKSFINLSACSTDAFFCCSISSGVVRFP